MLNKTCGLLALVFLCLALVVFGMAFMIQTKLVQNQIIENNPERYLKINSSIGNVMVAMLCCIIITLLWLIVDILAEKQLKNLIGTITESNEYTYFYTFSQLTSEFLI